MKTDAINVKKKIFDQNLYRVTLEPTLMFIHTFYDANVLVNALARASDLKTTPPTDKDPP